MDMDLVFMIRMGI